MINIKLNRKNKFWENDAVNRHQDKIKNIKTNTTNLEKLEYKLNAKSKKIYENSKFLITLDKHIVKENIISLKEYLKDKTTFNNYFYIQILLSKPIARSYKNLIKMLNNKRIAA